MPQYKVTIKRTQYLDVVVEAENGKAAMEVALIDLDEKTADWWTGDLHAQTAGEL